MFCGASVVNYMWFCGICGIHIVEFVVFDSDALLVFIFYDVGAFQTPNFWFWWCSCFAMLVDS